MKMELRKTFQFEAAHLLPRLPKSHKCRRLDLDTVKTEIAPAHRSGRRRNVRRPVRVPRLNVPQPYALNGFKFHSSIRSAGISIRNLDGRCSVALASPGAMRIDGKLRYSSLRARVMAT